MFIQKLVNTLFTKNKFVFTTSLKMTSDFANVRVHYGDPKDSFDLEHLASKDVIKQFDAWFQEARKNPGVREPNAVCLSTATKEGKPSSRMVLLKDYTEKGFTFFTNYSSRKGQELEQNPQASLCFYWDVMSRQVRVDGRVVKIDRDLSVEYFGKRPFNSRISALVSEQSKVVACRQELSDAQKQAAEKYENDQNGVPTPENWGGYLLIPDEVEFWRGNDIRLHDRLRFRRLRDGEQVGETGVLGENGWVIERLAP